MGIYVQTPAPVAADKAKRQAAMDRSIARAHQQAAAGVVPLLLATTFTGGAIAATWSVPSRTSDALYRVTLAHTAEAVVTTCDCQAGAAGRLCWHRGICRLAHEERVSSRTACGYRIRPQRKPAPVTAPVALPTIGGKVVDQSALTGRRRSA